ncbi:MAG: Protein-L-isoaspartate O-methyltransferase [uncultured Sphingosinicella sp.]|uniref:Protein-L-isoaspartate O-methyltransferase n=1 Tax=uncultured Sphingosinicella sp. TaxID=478748 RepID=A0A6J4U110_9SPHN|nr:MAG: Protein-L-isoaspartate O-methyltransferase [uncultured Sphingosinicella sp.]
MMVLAVENLAATAGSTHRRIDRKVLDAMRKVPRHLLVPQEVRAEAYQNRPLPIGYEATISQPYIVALMTDLLDVEPGHKVLEVGTGSGYQAAILSGLVNRVHSIEIVEPLAKRAGEQLAALGYRNVTVRAGDGYAGWPEQAPFDRIIVTAGADHVPRPLMDQLRPGGRMVIPVGEGGDLQLTVIDKSRKGRISKRRVLPVYFVPLTRKASSGG